jgi:hypothetical protein
MTEYLDLRQRARLENVIPIDPNLSPMDYLLARMRDPTVDEHVRTRIAIALLPFTVPKLQATALIGMGHDFAARLERAVLRSSKVKLIEGEPVAKMPGSLKEAKMIKAEPRSFKRRI